MPELNKLAEFCHKHRVSICEVEDIKLTFEPGAHVSVDDVIGKELLKSEQPKPTAYTDADLYSSSG